MAPASGFKCNLTVCSTILFIAMTNAYMVFFAPNLCSMSRSESSGELIYGSACIRYIFLTPL